MKKILLFLILLSSLAFTAYAANCGGTTVCNCGDTLNESRTLNATDNLTGCVTLTGLEITQPNVVLDCAGYMIDGVDQVLSSGILLQNQPNITVQNCNIADWAMGVKIAASASGCSILNNNISSNTDSTQGYGISLATTGNMVRGNNLDTNRYGIYMSGSSSGVLSNNYINNTILDAIYYGSSGVTNITNNTMINSARRGLNLASQNFRIWQNNIYNNVLNVYAGTWPDEISFNNQGNYWGHATCPLFIAGTDSNQATVTDSYPYSSAGSWDVGGSPVNCNMSVTLSTPA
ncbi:MAG: right-handed parallel beta-helix repeat-containing protein, partial [Candidatus Woesearchaeota archaeon]